MGQLKFPGVRPLPRGIMMLEYRGVGKSYAAKYIGQETGCHVEIIAAPEIKSKWVGEAGHNIKAVYAKAAARAKKSGKPAIVFIDEADAILGERQNGGFEDGNKEEQREILDMLFPLMDGPKAAKNVITIFASNAPQEFFDKALITRTKRITYIINMPLPNRETCLLMLQDAAGKYPQAELLLEDENAGIMNEMADLAFGNGFSPDNLYGLIDKAVNAAITAQQDPIIKAYKDKQPDEEMYQALSQAEEQATLDAKVLGEAFQSILDRLRPRDQAEGAEEPAQEAQAAATAAQGAPVEMPAVHGVAQGIPHAAAMRQAQPQGTLVERLLNLAEQIMQQNQALQRQLHPEQAAPVQPAPAAAQVPAQQQTPAQQLAAAALPQPLYQVKQVQPGAGRQRSDSLSTALRATLG